jgi:SSS family solute:Na+ symporter
MASYHLFFIILLVYISFLILTGFYFSKRQNSQTDFWLAGKSAGFLSVGFSAAASWLTAGALLAVIGFYMLLGMGSVWGFVAPNIIALFVIALFVKKDSLPARRHPAGAAGNALRPGPEAAGGHYHHRCHDPVCRFRHQGVCPGA